MKESDFPQFPDPRVREVMAAAANLVAAYEGEYFTKDVHDALMAPSAALKTALFAAQHSKPKPECIHGPDGVVIHADPRCKPGTYLVATFGYVCPTCGERP